MNALSLNYQQKTERLTDAFRVFNELSENLAQSYQGLQQQVANLNRELITARSERVVSLIEKEQLANRLQQILAALPAAVIVLNAQGQIIDCNTHALDYLGEPLLGLQWLDVVQRSLQPISDSPHERQLQDGRKVTITANALSNNAEQIILLSDVSEVRALQDALAQQKHLTAMGEMVASLAHQVRTPLSTAILYASQMSKPTLNSDKRQQYSIKILERLHYLERQVNDMLIFAKQGRLAMQGFTLTSLLKHVTEAMDSFDGRFELDNQVTDDALLGNEDALRGALLNLLGNAMEAGAKVINVTVQAVAAGIQIRVQDDGCGMDETMQSQLFEPFCTSKINGTGLGLAVVASVVKAHQGTVSCQSAIGQGACFTLLMPISDDWQGLSLSAACAAESI